MSDGRRGSVKQAENGTWYFIVDVVSEELDSRGRPKRKQTRRRGFKTKREAQAKLTEILGELSDQTYVAPQRQTLAEFLTNTWLPAIEHTIKPSTFESYRRNVRVHVARHPIGSRQLQLVDGPALNALYGRLLAGDAIRPALSPKSVHYVSLILHRAFRDAMRWQAVQRNPVDQSDPPRPQGQREMKTWTATELRTFLEGTADSRLMGAWWLLATTGMRRGEVLGLRWSDVDLDTARLSVTRTLIVSDIERKGAPGYSWGTPKTVKGRRQVAIDDATIVALRSHRARQLEERMKLGAGYEDQDLVVCGPNGGPQHPKRLSYYFLKESRRLGLPVIRLHDLRHTHATLALRAGVHPRIVQERLGHANVSITLDTYSHVDLDMQAAAAARVSALMAGEPR